MVGTLLSPPGTDPPAPRSSVTLASAAPDDAVEMIAPTEPIVQRLDPTLVT